MTVYRRFGKRAVDLITAIAASILLAPIMAVVAVVVRVSLGSPVLFRQKRPGWRGQPFTLLKFRTLADAKGADGALLPDADRVTTTGRWLRSLSLDELPELWNVVRGEMSLVGPRPLLMQYLPLYSAEQARRHDVKPGLTGLAQVSGRNALTWKEKFQYDVWYVDHVSFVLDVKIMLRTVAALLTRRGVVQPGHATAEEFTGTDQ